MNFFVEIYKSKGRYHGSIHQGNPSDATQLTDLKLGKNDKIIIRDKAYKIGDLVRALIGYSSKDLQIAFDDRGQLEIGQYLYKHVFSELKTEQKKMLLSDEEPVQIRIVTEDEDIARLPWVLIAKRGVFLSMTGCAVTLSCKRESQACELPPSPKMLIVAPCPQGSTPTQAEAHLEELEKLFSARDRHLRIGEKLAVARTWEEFTHLVKTFQPVIVYYYGHGKGDVHKARLLFAQGEKRKLKEVPLTNFAQSLRNMNPQPKIAYINCCQGDASGYLGVGLQLGEFIPAVITNRTKAEITAAREQALNLWDNILFKGAAPHIAMNDLYVRVNDLGLSAADVRWMTPVLYTGYDRWHSHPPQPESRLERDPHWPLKIDRVPQFGTISHLTGQMLREGKPKSLAFVWYGLRGQGLDIFHRRLDVELKEILHNTEVYTVAVNWPPALDNIDRAFQAEFAQGFGVAFDAIDNQIRLQNRGASGRYVLVYIQHKPLEINKKILPLQKFTDYLHWWDSVFVPKLGSRHFALLGISYIVKKPDKFQEVINNQYGFDSLIGNCTVFELLGEMKSLVRKHILNFIKTHQIYIPKGREVEVVDYVLAQTDGHYEKTVEFLRNIEDLIGALPSQDNSEPDYYDEENL